MKKSLKVGLLAAAVSVALVSNPAYSQSTFSSIRGKVTNDDGQARSNITVSVEDTRTGMVRTYTTNDNGSFFASNLPVGGPYKVTVGDGKPVTIPYLALGDIYKLDLSSKNSVQEEVLVVGTASAPIDVASGPAATFTSVDLRESLALNRDIKDVYSLDPRLSIDDPDRGGALNCAGKHPRFSSITLDGVSYNDRFGLNDNGYATASGMPFPYDAIENVAVELAPMDVTYSGFSACNINAVTKTGSNEWHGNVFFEWSSDDLRGDSYHAEGEAVTRESKPFNERKKGFTIGGPIIEDKLFIFAAYEDSVRPRFLAMGHEASGNGEERTWLNQADYQRVSQIAKDVYNYDPGGMPGDGVIEDEKYMLRADWAINDQHNATFIYNYYDGTEDRASDNDDNEFEFANHFYVKGSESTTYTAKLTSQWTDALSTEFYYSSTEMNDSQVTVGPQDFAEMQISVGSNTIYLGADDSRQANGLNTESDFFKVNAKYLWQDHIFTAGFEREELEIFNLFVQQSRGGEYRFFNDTGVDDNPSLCDALTAQGRLDNAQCKLSGIDRFELGLSSRAYYSSGGGTNVAADAGANFSNTLNSFYIQDEFYYSPAALTVVAGLRYELFSSSDSPNYNPVFSEANGVRNDANIDGLDILLPRLGLTWEASDNLIVRAGIGRFSGGNPNVWISNAWSNDGVTKVDARIDGLDIFDTLLSGDGRVGYDVPQALKDIVASVTPADGSNNGVVLLDPNYKQPSEWKYSLGTDYFFDNGVKVQADLLYTQIKDSAIYVDLSQSVVGTTILGQPIYDYTNGRDNLMLTNSSRDASAHTLSVVVSKEFDFGLDTMFGYAYTNAEDISPMTSAVAQSNYDNNALLDINDPIAGSSNYEVPHRFTMKLSYRKNFFADLETRVSLFGYRKSGQGVSVVMDGQPLEGDGFFGRHLMYIPNGENDPNAVFVSDSTEETAAFYNWASQYDPGFIPRNSVTSRWSTRFDLRIDQELPTFVNDTSGRVFLKIYNLGNLLNDEWGLQSDARFYSQEVVDVNINDSGQYVYSNFREPGVNDYISGYSVWQARLGIEFEF